MWLALLLSFPLQTLANVVSLRSRAKHLRTFLVGQLKGPPHLQASRVHCVPDSSLINLLPEFTSVCDNAVPRAEC